MSNPLSNDRLERVATSPELARQWVAVALAVVVAAGLGWLIGTSAWLLLILALVVAVNVFVVSGLRDRSWVLIVLGWWFTGYTAVLPVPVSGRDLAILLAACAYVAHYILAVRRAPVRWHTLDSLLLVNLVWLGITFAIHPVGLRSMGASTVGARPFVNVMLAAIAFWIMLRLPRSWPMASRIPYLILAGTGFASLLYGISFFFPGAAERLRFLYALVDVGAYFAKDAFESDIPRAEGLSRFGVALLVWVCAYHAPQSLLNPLRLRFYSLLLAMSCILASGYRSSFLWVVPAFGIGSWLRGGGRLALLAAGRGGVLLARVVGGQGRLYELPLPMQRSLAFLPGDWSPLVEADAAASTEWRVEWWKQIIKGGTIENWWVGDGFGFSVEDYRARLASAQMDSHEWFALTGAFHNGPLSTIRYVGVIGLVCFYVLMVGMAIQSIRTVVEARGSPFFPVALFLVIQICWTPIHYTFVFGGFDSQLPTQIFWLALLRLVIRMLKEWQQAQAGPPAVRPVPLAQAAMPAGV